MNTAEKLQKIWIGLAFIVVIALAAAWKWTVLGQVVNLQVLEKWEATLRGHPWTPVAVVLIFTIGGSLAFPHSILIWAVALTFSPLQGIIYAELGTVASGITMFRIGRMMKRSVLNRILGSRLEQVLTELARHGRAGVIVMHLFPIVPFSVLNLASGTSPIRFTDFLIGTIIGSTPGVVIVCLFGHRLIGVIKAPNWLDFIYLSLFVGVATFVYRKSYRLIKSKRAN